MLSTLRRHLRAPATVALLAFSALTMFAPAAQAGIVGTEQALAGSNLDAARTTLVNNLARADIRAALVAHGVDPAMVDARVASLSDDEVNALNQRMEQMPAGGDILGTLAIIFLILLFTDLMGWTSIFPFTKKGSINN